MVVVHEGRSNFSELQAELAAGRQGRLVYYVFDLLWGNGDLRQRPQIERKQALLELLGENDIELPILYSEHLTGDGQKMFEHAAKLNWEGIISKRAEAPYKSERGEAWVKVKAVQREKFPIVGFVKDPSGVAALYLGKKEGKDLVYRGKVGTGAPSQAKSESSLIRSSAQSQSSPRPSGSRRRLGSNRNSLPTLNTGTSRRRACCVLVRSRIVQGNRAHLTTFVVNERDDAIQFGGRLPDCLGLSVGAGELGNPERTANHLLDTIEAMIRHGERRPLLLSKRAMASYQRFRAELGLTIAS